jgi:LmbE family N-acetylglucosaminyl deacetylase
MAEAPPSPLQPLREDWTRALAIVAHPGDMEYGTAAAVARWTGQGKTVMYTMASSGEAGIDGMEPEKARGVREAEQVAAARLVGVDVVEFLGHPDGMIEYGLPLRRDLARVIRRHQPEIVITTNFRETWSGVFPNQADHVAVGRAVLDAVRDAANRWVFRELLDEGLGRWDITDSYARGLESLKAHAAYLAGLGEAVGDPDEFLEAMSRQTGSRLGTRYAAACEVLEMSWE